MATLRHKPRSNQIVPMWLSSNTKGLTLIELLVSVAIISILASVAIPYAEITVRRDKEIELHRALRVMRSAIDAFHRDWLDGKIAAEAAIASDNGYPRKFATLTDGINLTDGQFKRYLRRIPRNPLSIATLPPGEQWQLRGYAEALDAQFWNEKDIYDVKVSSDRQALDGSYYKDW